MSIALRPAGLDDAPVLSALHGEAFAEAWSSEAMKDLLAMPGSVAFVFEDEGGVRGFVLARIAAGEGEILSVAVQKNCRRRGLGRALLVRIATEAQHLGADEFFLEVAVDNSAALGLYSGLGFVSVGGRKAYYARGEAPAVDAMILRASLPLVGEGGSG